MSAKPRILAVNPNTSEEVTDNFVAAARRIAPEGIQIDGVTGRFGARIVSTEPENVIAGHSALELVAEHAGGYDAIILAISLDTPLRALQALMPIPVVAISQAAVKTAGAGGRRFGAIVFGTVSRQMYERLFAEYGTEPLGCEVIEIGSAADYLSPQAQDDAVVAAGRRLAAGGAEAVVICGAAIVGMAARLADRFDVPVFDGLESVPQCLALLAPGAYRPQPTARPVGPTVGLSPALTALLAGDAPGPRR